VAEEACACDDRLPEDSFGVPGNSRRERVTVAAGRNAHRLLALVEGYHPVDGGAVARAFDLVQRRKGVRFLADRRVHDRAVEAGRPHPHHG
jgi:hypothetical protein